MRETARASHLRSEKLGHSPPGPCGWGAVTPRRSRLLLGTRRTQVVVPEGAHLFGQVLPDFLDLAPIHMPREDPEHGPGRIPHIYRWGRLELLVNEHEELV